MFTKSRDFTMDVSSEPFKFVWTWLASLAYPNFQFWWLEPLLKIIYSVWYRSLDESHSNKWISAFQSSCCSSLVTAIFVDMYSQHFLKATGSYNEYVTSNLQGSVTFIWYFLSNLLLMFGNPRPFWYWVLEYFQSHVILLWLHHQHLSKQSQFS